MSSSFFAAMTAICFFCFLFSFLINCPFSSSCCASRDQANHVSSAYREHHEEDGSGSNGRQHNKAVFLIVVQLVPISSFCLLVCNFCLLVSSFPLPASAAASTSPPNFSSKSRAYGKTLLGLAASEP